MADLNGSCDPRFERVAEALSANIDAGKEVGASIYLNLGGEEVVDLWGGWREHERTASWDEHTLVNVFSGSKPVASLALLTLVEQGKLNVDKPVCSYWPEFAQNGKEGVLVRHLMSHSAGLPGWEPPFSYENAMDVEGSTARLAAQAPWWEPGTRASYHASTFGHLAAELFRRASGGVELGDYIDAEIAGPLQADFYLGLKDEEFDRVATVYPAPEDNGTPPPQPVEGWEAPVLSEADVISNRTRAGSFAGTMGDPLTVFNSPAWRRTRFAGSSGHANARGLGRIMAVLSQGGASRGVSLLSQDTISLIFREQYHDIDPYYRKPIRWGIGYALAPPERKERGPLPFIRPGSRTCFWYGTGGSIALADLDRGIAFGYAMNQCQAGRNQLNGQYYNEIYAALDDALSAAD